jgi:ATP-dependent DNA helicase RecQ
VRAVTADLARILRETFGHAAFRPGQETVIKAILSGRSTLAVMPTGAGKSLCYQLPATILGGTTLVVSPLIALIRDQVRALSQCGIPVAAITSQEGPKERREAQQALAEGRLRLAYVAPERFRSRSFLDALSGLPIELFAVDEAHCIAEWGHDFRPDYARLGEVIERLRPKRVMGLTATATPEVREQIVRSLGLCEPEVVVTGFDRQELALSVIETTRGKAKLEALDRTLRTWMGPSGSAIVYVGTRKRAETTALVLAEQGYQAEAYHAGLPSDRRLEVEQTFSRGTRRVVVATTAFGMGVDKADVRVVVHAQIPSAPEAYYQEVGRAGRDGQRAAGVLLYDSADLRLAYARFEASCPTYPAVLAAFDLAVHTLANEPLGFEALAERIEREVGPSARAALVALEQAGDLSFEDGRLQVMVPAPTVSATRLEARARQERQRLDAMIGYVTRAPCRRRYLVDYFGDTRRPERCEVCDRCQQAPARALSEVGRRDVLIALSCVARMRGRYGKQRVADVLLGSRAKPILEAKLDTLSTHGLLKGLTKEEVLALLDALIRAEFAKIAPGDYPKLLLTEGGAGVLKDKEAPVALDLTLSRWSSAPKKAEDSPALAKDDEALFERLRSWRVEQARAQGVPPYVIAHDRLLRAIASVRPQSLDVLAELPGVGRTKLERYGTQLLALVEGQSLVIDGPVGPMAVVSQAESA